MSVYEFDALVTPQRVAHHYNSQRSRFFGGVTMTEVEIRNEMQKEMQSAWHRYLDLLEPLTYRVAERPPLARRIARRRDVQVVVAGSPECEQETPLLVGGADLRPDGLEKGIETVRELAEFRPAEIGVHVHHGFGDG